jgi:hypothetical protein
MEKKLRLINYGGTLLVWLYVQLEYGYKVIIQNCHQSRLKHQCYTTICIENVDYFSNWKESLVMLMCTYTWPQYWYRFLVVGGASPRCFRCLLLWNEICLCQLSLWYFGLYQWVQVCRCTWPSNGVGVRVLPAPPPPTPSCCQRLCLKLDALRPSAVTMGNLGFTQWTTGQLTIRQGWWCAVRQLKRRKA